MALRSQLASGQRAKRRLDWCEMGGSLRLLIVDDQPESLAGLAGLLEDRGHRVDIVTDPLEALVQLQRSARDPYHLVITDVNLPSLDGPGLVREMRLRGHQMPVAFITGYNSVAIRLRSELGALRAIGLLTKPASVAEVERILENAARIIRGSTQDRRATDFGLGSGGHNAIGSGGYRTLAPGHGSGGHRTLPSGSGPGLGSGGHPLVGHVPGPAAADDIPFYGTSKTFRAKMTTPAPTEGILSRVQRPASQPDIIPDHLIGGGLPQTPAAPSGLRRGVSPQPPPDASGRRPAAREPSNFFPTTPEPPQPETGRRGTDFFTPVAPTDINAIRDPVTGNFRRTPSGMTRPPSGSMDRPGTAHPPQREAEPDAYLPGTTSRFRRSVGGDPVAGDPQRPVTGAGNPITSRIRRGITGSHPKPIAEAVPEAPTCTVACAHCQGQFNVLVKAQAYTVLCVHCGQINRIDPL